MRDVKETRNQRGDSTNASAAGYLLAFLFRLLLLLWLPPTEESAPEELLKLYPKYRD